MAEEHERKTGWEALNSGQPAEEIKDETDKKVKAERMAKARSFEMAFKGVHGRAVLSDLHRMAFGRPRYEFDHPNCEIIAAVRGGYQQMFEYIEGQINLSKVGEKS